MWVQGKMELKLDMHTNIPLHIQKLKFEEGVYGFNDPIGEEALGSKLSSKFGLAKRTPFTSFLSHLLGIV